MPTNSVLKSNFRQFFEIIYGSQATVMKLAGWANAAEIIGAVVLVLSLLYVGREWYVPTFQTYIDDAVLADIQ